MARGRGDGDGEKAGGLRGERRTANGERRGDDEDERERKDRDGSEEG